MGRPFFYLYFNHSIENHLQYAPHGEGRWSANFHHSALQRRAVWLALFAILLIVVAPLISIALQKNPMNGMHHAMMGMPEGMPSHQMSVTHTDASMPEHAHSVPLIMLKPVATAYC